MFMLFVLLICFFFRMVCLFFFKQKTAYELHRCWSSAVSSSGLVVDADEVRLTQVVSNLLTNAGRYTAVGGRIEVTAARDGGEVVLNVHDNGRGIDAALLPNVFDMFVQGPRGSDRSQGGLGLGLSLVRTLTEL